MLAKKGYTSIMHLRNTLWYVKPESTIVLLLAHMSYLSRPDSRAHLVNTNRLVSC